tara:strand:+ start:464 stop:1051 length:588 start_codon:yes stop_codon:yes gene_type:complete
MIVIGVLGDIGSGKSFISKQFGYPVFNADEEVNKIYRKNINCYKKLKKKLPNYIKKYPIDKNKLGRAILDNDKNLKKIVNIVHPIIRKEMKSFLKKNKNKKMVVLDIPLLIENKLNKKNDILIFIDAKKSNINLKLKKRLNYNSKLISSLRKLQKPLYLKKKMSNYVIKNNFKLLTLKKRVKLIKDKILNVRNST